VKNVVERFERAVRGPCKTEAVPTVHSISSASGANSRPES
jgi:hypothetical protein